MQQHLEHLVGAGGDPLGGYEYLGKAGGKLSVESRHRVVARLDRCDELFLQASLASSRATTRWYSSIAASDLSCASRSVQPAPR